MPSPLAALCANADSLFRAAAESCRQHVRYARLVRAEVCPQEQQAACDLAIRSDELLRELVAMYEGAVMRPDGRDDERWWHAANMLLHACREHVRHQQRCDQDSRGSGAHSPDHLEALTIGYELAASALLALRRAVEEYRRVRPEAELTGQPAA